MIVVSSAECYILQSAILVLVLLFVSYSYYTLAHFLSYNLVIYLSYCYNYLTLLDMHYSKFHVISPELYGASEF